MGAPSRPRRWHDEKTGAAAGGADALFGEGGEGADEVGDGSLAGVEEVEVEVETPSGRDGEAAEVGGAKDEGARGIGEAAGAGSLVRLEDAGVGAGGGGGASARARAGRIADDAAEIHPQSSPQGVAGQAGREVDGVQRGEFKTKRKETEQHSNLSVASGAGGGVP